MLTEKEIDEIRAEGYEAAYTLLLPKLRQAEERVKRLEEALKEISSVAPFITTYKIRPICEKALSTEPKGE